jgi:hypothetical protein
MWDVNEYVTTHSTKRFSPLRHETTKQTKCSIDVNLSIKNVTGGILIFIVPNRISVKNILNVSHNDNKAWATQVFSN